MATGTKYSTKLELLNSIQALVYENDGNETDSEDIQKASKNIIESLWDKTVPAGTAKQTLYFDEAGVLTASSMLNQDNSGVLTHTNNKADSVFRTISGNQKLSLKATTQNTANIPFRIDAFTPSGIPILVNSIAKLRIEIVGIQTAGSAGTIGDCCTRVITGVVKNISGTPVNMGSGLTVSDVIEDVALSGCNLLISNAAGKIDIAIQGQLNKSIAWTAYVNMTICTI